METADDVEELVFRTLLEHPVPVAIFCWHVTEGWAVDFVSPNVIHVLGYSAEDFLAGRVLYAQIIHPDDLARVTGEVATHSASQEAVFEHEDYRIIDPQKKTRWVRDLTAIVRDRDGRPTRYIGYIFESTARHEALEALAEAKREAEAATLARTEFFTNVSHEFRTPLTLLLGPLDDLLSGPLEAAQREALETMRRSALRLLRLVSSLLAFAPIDAGRARATYAPTDLATYTRELASLFESAATNAGLQLVVDCPSLDEPAWVDAEMWEKIVSNLLSNALKFTLQGRIHVSLQKEGDRIRLEVEDTGAGIPEVELARIFERFHRIKGVRARSQEGSGIGLPLVQELVRLHGGSVAVRSKEGSGSTFTVTIPRGRAHLPADRVSNEEAQPAVREGASAYALEAATWAASPPTIAGTSGRPRIVLADDNADMRSYLLRMLGAAYDVEAYADGKQALDAIRRSPPDIVITDIMMPVMGGLELLTALRSDARTRPLPIVFLSARAGEEARVEGIVAGADDYLVKPFSARELLARVSTQLALAQLRRQAEHVRRLEAEQAWLGAALDRMPFPLVLIDPATGCPTHANRAANTMAGGVFPLGIPFSEYARHFRVTDEQDREIPVDEWPALRAARGEPVDRVVVVWHSPTGRIPVLTSAQLLPAMSDHAATVVLVFEDVSDLVRAIRARDEFLSIASHELKTPLTSLKMQTQLRERALTAGKLSAFTPDALARMVSSDARQIDRLTRLVDDMLDVSRISSGRFSLTLDEPVDLVASVREVLERSAAYIAAAGCEVTLDAPAPVVGRWDRMRIEQVVLNLLTNATKYGRGKPIRCAVRAEGERAVLTIEDRGIGIAPDDQERIFEAFERAVSASQVSGLGLGLYIARRIVEAHGGTIRVHSESGTGSIFTVELPTRPPLVDGGPR